MAALTPIVIKSPFAAITADSADAAWTAGTTGAGDTFACTGRQILEAYNSGGSSYTLTITSVADEKARTGDITTYNLDAGEFAVFGVGLTNEQGWKGATGTIAVTVSNAAVKWRVLTLPAGYPK